MRHLLVTNDFPPKVGGIQTYLWELWRRLPPEAFAVLTTAHPEAPAFDAAQPFRVERVSGTVLWPTPDLRRRIDRLAAALDAGCVALRPALTLAVAGTGRDRQRLERLATRRHAPVRFLGRVADDRLPALYACADVFAAPNRVRWGGLEQEGFGIVFVEAAACGIPQVAGDNGGAPEAVVHGETGLLVERPGVPSEVASALERLIGDPPERCRLGEQSRRRAADLFAYDVLAARLAAYLTA